MRVPFAERGVRPLLVLAVAIVHVAGGCSLEKTEQEGLIGPSETGVSVEMLALPDTLNADGVSASTVQLVLRDASGQPVKGLSVWFYLEGDGRLLPSPASLYVGPLQNGFVMATDNNGVANVVYIAGTSPGSIRVYARPYVRQTFKGIPKELEEAAALDGCGGIRFLLHVAIPLALPGYLGFGLVSITYHWNEFFWPLVVTETTNSRTLTLGLGIFAQTAEGSADWTMLMAMTLMVIAVPLVVFLIFQRRFINSFMQSGLGG